MKIWPFRPKKNPESPPREASGFRQQLENIMTQISEHKKARVERWLDDRIKRGRKEYFGESVELSPELAQVLLERNPENRHVSEDTVSVYERDIRSGRWVVNGEPIIISQDGFLNDGQHRCHAVVRTGKPITVIAVFGVARESRLTTNQGKTKTVGDFLSMEDVPNSNNIAAIAARIVDIRANGRLSSGMSKRATKQEVLEFAMDNGAILDAFRKVDRPGARRICNLSILGTAVYFINEKNPVLVDEFLSKLIEGTGMEAKDPVFVCREKLLARDLRLTANEKIKAIFTAWNHWRDGKPVKTIVHNLKAGEKLPALRP